jgi:hypothetical protein
MIGRPVRGACAVGLAVAAAWLAVAPVAHAEPAGDAVALLPLDADRSLEIYGQPVASEIARALVAGNVAVVVVGPKMAVPERARLIIDGTITLGKASAVTISLRVRNTLDGLVLDTLSATAPGLAKIDGAAAELSARALPLVRDRLGSLRKPAPVGQSSDFGRVQASAPPRAPLADPIVLVGVAAARGAPPAEALRAALATALTTWTRTSRREPRTADPARLVDKLAAQTVRASGASLAIGCWIAGYTVEPGVVPMARARVRVRITDRAAVVFDRVVVTDTVLGDKGLAPDELAARVAREVLAIVEPHLQRSVPWWR